MIWVQFPWDIERDDSFLTLLCMHSCQNQFCVWNWNQMKWIGSVACITVMKQMRAMQWGCWNIMVWRHWKPDTIATTMQEHPIAMGKKKVRAEDVVTCFGHVLTLNSVMYLCFGGCCLCRKMTQHMQESTAQGVMKNFNQEMQASIKNPSYEAPIFIGNDFDIRYDYKLQLQECIQHPISFHAEMRNDGQYHVPTSSASAWGCSRFCKSSSMNNVTRNILTFAEILHLSYKYFN